MCIIVSSLFPQARQNVVDVNHHVTQYIHIIGDLNHQIARLKRELNRDRAKLGAAMPESSEVTSLYENLKALVTDQRELRHQLLELECALLQNSFECQQRRTCIQDWEQKREELDLATLTAPPSTVPPSPSLMPCTDPLGTDSTSTDPLTDPLVTDSTSTHPLTLQYIVDPSTESHLSLGEHRGHPNINTDPLCSQYPMDPSASEEPSKDPLNDVISLKQAGNIASTSRSASNHVYLDNKANVSVVDGTDTGCECATISSCEESTGGAGDTSICDNKLRKNPLPVKPRHVLPEFRFLMSVSPDSGTELSLMMPTGSEQEGEDESGDGPGGGGEGVTVVEPAAVQLAREELEGLEARKVKMERQHRALHKKLGVVKDSVTDVKEVAQ